MSRISYRLRPSLIVAVIAVLSIPSAGSAYRPSPRALYHDGPSGRYLLAGNWLFRSGGGGKNWHRSRGRKGWKVVTVPNAWNSADETLQSMTGGIGWYRKDFRVPKGGGRWIVRFESVNYRAKVWLNGKPVGSHAGAYIPFEIPLNRLKQGKANRLVVRVDSRRLPTDFPPTRESEDGVGTGGWWNYGGILREVYIRRVRSVDWGRVEVRPNLPCPTCPATIAMKARVKNVTAKAKRVRVTARFGNSRLSLGSKKIGARSSARFSASLRLKSPRLWTPRTPNLYQVRLTVKGDAGPIARYRLKAGVRSIRVVNGRITINGKPLTFRGVGAHEDSQQAGFAIDSQFRQRLVSDAKAVGANLIRTHYPFHPHIHELADRLGLLIWSEIPVFQNREEAMAPPKVRAAALRLLRDNIETHGNHPSVLLWSIGNELSSRPGPVLASYFKKAANLAHTLDPSRPVALATYGYPSVPCQATAYRPIQVIGINDYFGWYPGPSGQVFDRKRLAPYLESARNCYAGKAVAVTEFGAEANRDGPFEEKGTWTYQREFVNFHLAVFASKPWLSGFVYWALREFRVRPNWDGGNPRPKSPIHQKGLVTYDGQRKPAWDDLRRAYLSVTD